MTRTDSGILFILTNSRMAEGTVFTRVTPAAFASSASSSALPTTTVEPPQLRGTKISNTERSKQIDVDANTRDSSSGKNVSRHQCKNATTLEWQIATPLGFPVEPEV